VPSSRLFSDTHFADPGDFFRGEQTLFKMHPSISGKNLGKFPLEKIR
jgi:hypothetical protein